MKKYVILSSVISIGKRCYLLNGLFSLIHLSVMEASITKLL